nr:tRNA-dihydrouridine(20) synthase [NAD(P)+]-like [Tanacetum cinerariifolium]
CKDIAAIDVSMGCPKVFSISGGMKIALFNKPNLIHDATNGAYVIIVALWPDISLLKMKISSMARFQNKIGYAGDSMPDNRGGAQGGSNGGYGSAIAL